MADFTEQQLKDAAQKAFTSGDMKAAEELAQAAMSVGASSGPATGLPEGYTLLGTTDDGGRIYQKADGQRGFVSPGYSTTDPATIDKLMQGVTLRMCSLPESIRPVQPLNCVPRWPRIPRQPSGNR